MESVLLDPNEISQFLASYDDKEIRVCEAVLLPQPEKVYVLLDIQFPALWESIRENRKGLPTIKTAIKHLSADSEKISRSSQKKFISALPVPKRLTELTKNQIENGFSVPTATHWLGFLSLACSNPAVLDYWEEKLYELSHLSGPVIRSQPKKIDRFIAYSDAEVVETLGCPASRQLLPKLLAELEDDHDFASNKELTQLLGADMYSVLLRLAAWLMAESQVEKWDVEVREGTQNVIHAGWVIPSWCSSSNSWSNPIEKAFEKLAKLAGRTGNKQKPVTYLGKIWAASDAMEDASRIRLLRNWVQLKGGRPSFNKLLDLMHVCFDIHFRERELPTGTTVGYWEGACIFRFAETMSLIIRDAQKSGWPNDLLISMMSVYETEYRTARRLMGRPIVD